MKLFSIEKTAGQRKTTELILRVLGEHGSMNVAQIRRALADDSKIKISYQGARKAVNALIEDSILERANSLVSLNRGWLLDMRSFVDTLLAKSGTNITSKKIITEVSKSSRCDFLTHSLLETDNLWGDLLSELVRSKLKARTTIFSIGYFAWWLLLNLGRETDLFTDLSQKHLVEMTLLRTVPLNRWAASIYRRTGVNIKVANGANGPENLAFNVVGDYVIKVEIPAELNNKISSFFRNCSKVNEDSICEFLKIAKLRRTIQVSVIYDPIFAQGIVALYGLK